MKMKEFCVRIVKRDDSHTLENIHSNIREQLALGSQLCYVRLTFVGLLPMYLVLMISLR